MNGEKNYYTIVELCLLNASQKSQPIKRYREEHTADDIIAAKILLLRNVIWLCVNCRAPQCDFYHVVFFVFDRLISLSTLSRSLKLLDEIILFTKNKFALTKQSRDNSGHLTLMNNLDDVFFFFHSHISRHFLLFNESKMKFYFFYLSLCCFWFWHLTNIEYYSHKKLLQKICDSFYLIFVWLNK